MNFIHLKYIVEIASRGSISKASEVLHVAQPNLSRALKELESDFGIVLFERTAKGMALTADGDSFVQYAKAILNQIQLVEDIYKKGMHGKRQFSISVPRGSHIGEAFVQFTQSLPNKPFDVYYHETNASNAINNILYNDYRLGIIRYASRHDAYFKRMLADKCIQHELIAEFQYVLLVSKDSALAQKEEVHLSDLADYIEVAHADPYVPSLSLSVAKREESLVNVDRKIYVYERGSQFSLLSQNHSTFMWVSPIPQRLKALYGLVEIRCKDNERYYKDILIYRQGYVLTEMDKQFITELTKSKRACL